MTLHRHEPCPKLSETLLWAHGEGDDAIAVHVATCPECSQAVAEAESVLWALPVGVPERAPLPAANRGWGWIGLGASVAAAAAVLLIVAPLALAPSTGSSSGEPALDTTAPVERPEPVVRLDPPSVFDADEALDHLYEDVEALAASFASL